MAQKKSKRIKIIDTSSAATYHTVRIAQRLTLLAAAGMVVAYIATIVSITISLLVSGVRDVSAGNPDQLNNIITRMTGSLKIWALSMAIVSLLVTAILTLFPRVRRYDKKSVVDNIVIAVALITAVIIGPSLLQYIMFPL